MGNFIIKAVAPTAYQSRSLSHFNLNEKKVGNGSIIGIMEFPSEEHAKQYLMTRAEMYFETEQELFAAYGDIEHGALTLDAVTAYIKEIE